METLASLFPRKGFAFREFESLVPLLQESFQPVEFVRELTNLGGPSRILGKRAYTLLGRSTNGVTDVPLGMNQRRVKTFIDLLA